MELTKRAALAAAALISGLMTAALYAPFGFWPLGWVCLAPLLWAVARARTRLGATLLGLAMGIACRLASIPWVVHTMMVYGNMPWPAAIGALALLVVYMALYPATIAFLIRKPLERQGPIALFLVPWLWVAGELLLAFVLTGFPWNPLGNGVVGFLPAIQIADIAGVYGVSFVLALASSAVAFALLKHKELAQRSTWMPLAAAAAVVAAALAYGFVKTGDDGADGEAFRVALLQDDLTNAERPLSLNKAGNDLLLDYYARTLAEARAGADLVVWGEGTMVFLDMEQDKFAPWAYELDIYALARDEGIWLLLGTNDYFDGYDKLHNSAFTIDPGDPRNRPAGRYDKVHLTPFGEYVPYPWLLGWVPQMIPQISDFTPGEEIKTVPLMGGQVGVPVCYEIIFPDLVRRFVSGGAGLLATISNDAWFGRSAANDQHFDHAIMRAVENRRWLVRCAATGVSGIVAPDGRVVERTGIYVKTAVRGEVVMRSGLTIYASVGDIFAWACLIFSAASLLWLRYNDRPRGR